MICGSCGRAISEETYHMIDTDKKLRFTVQAPVSKYWKSVPPRYEKVITAYCGAWCSLKDSEISLGTSKAPVAAEYVAVPK